ncbi:MAG: hypothetical protein JKY65_00840 [Planctomycetes bacterium]|nr:hypothetical protein [Planctomycetota bacterium]
MTKKKPTKEKPSTKAALVAERLRRGALSENQAALAAWLGSEAALSAVGGERASEAPPPAGSSRDAVEEWISKKARPWLKEFQRFGVEASVRATLAICAWYTIPTWERITGRRASEVSPGPLGSPPWVEDEDEAEPSELEALSAWWGPSVEYPIRAYLVARRATLNPTPEQLATAEEWTADLDMFEKQIDENGFGRRLRETMYVSWQAAQAVCAELAVTADSENLASHPAAPDFVRDRWKRSAAERALAALEGASYFALMSTLHDAGEGSLPEEIARDLQRALADHLNPWALGHGDLGEAQA